ncbi:MAG: caspase family protein [Saprospiraceae bacterium]
MPKRDEIPINEEYQRKEMPFGRNFLLIIGINKYTNGITQLNNAVPDAVAFRDCLLQQYQFNEENCISLLDENATYDRIINQFDTLTTRLNENDNLVFYFSGHGVFIDQIGTGFWLLANSQKGKRHTFLPNDEIIRLIRNSKAKHIFGIVDSCFSGALFRNQQQQFSSRRYNYKSRYLLTSGRLETVEDGIPGKHSPFAQCLLDHLKNTPDDYTWGGSLCRVVLDNFTYDHNLQQPCGEPLHGVGHRNGEFIFLKKDVNASETILNIPNKENPFLQEDIIYDNAENHKIDGRYNIKKIDQLNINTGERITNNYYADKHMAEDKKKQPMQASKAESFDFLLLLEDLKQLENDHAEKRVLIKLVESAYKTFLIQPENGIYQLHNIFLQLINKQASELKEVPLPDQAKQHLLNNLDSLFTLLSSSSIEKPAIEVLLRETRLIPVWYQIDVELSEKIQNLLQIITFWYNSI